MLPCFRVGWTVLEVAGDTVTGHEDAGAKLAAARAAKAPFDIMFGTDPRDWETERSRYGKIGPLDVRKYTLNPLAPAGVSCIQDTDFWVTGE